MSDQPPTPATRIDKWLWAARAFKTRSIAAAACDGGKVAVNDQSAKPHKLVRPGDIVRFRWGDVQKTWRVIAIGERRGPAVVAQTLYEDLEPPRPPAETPALPRWTYNAPPARRPNKKERRQLGRLKRG